MTIYKEPLYYELAFSFVNIKKQINLFEKFIEKFSKIKVKSVLDIGCGPSLQLREIAKRGYEAVGLDLNSQMLKYLKEKAKEEGIKIETVKADMIDFKIKKVDFAFIMMGTIGYIKSNEEFLKHMDSVADSLKKGGLYLIENFALDWANKNLFKPQKWVMKNREIKVQTGYQIELKDTLNQLITETIRLEVHDNGREIFLKENKEKKLIFPQEFIELVKINKKFEFLGWFEHDKLKPLTKAKMDNIVILRRK